MGRLQLPYYEFHLTLPMNRCSLTSCCPQTAKLRLKIYQMTISILNLSIHHQADTCIMKRTSLEHISWALVSVAEFCPTDMATGHFPCPVC